MSRANLLSGVLLFALSQPVLGATLVEIRDGEGGTQKMWIEGQKMRVEDSVEPGHMLIYPQQKKMYVVNHQERQVMDMSGLLSNSGGPPQVTGHKVDLVKRGDGPVIAGYDTDHYELMVNGRKCSDEYLSRRALSDIAAMDAFEALSGMATEGPMGIQMMEPCDAANLQLKDTYGTHGYPMRIVRIDGSLESEVIRVTKNTPAPAGGFSLPADYRVVNFEQMVREAMPPSGLPEGVDPAEMEQVMKEMMKRMEQK